MILPRRTSNIVGLTLLAVCFTAALWQMATRQTAVTSDGVKTITVAHWQLETGLRDAFETIARAYEQRHPDVRIVQLPVPESVYSTWLTTQLVGDTAPDLIQLARGGEARRERLVRYFLPISHRVQEPNPYNRGTPAEHTTWQNTFLGGLASNPEILDLNLLDIYGVPLAANTNRIYINRALYQQIFGSRPYPRTFEEFIAVCEQVQRHAAAHAPALSPISGSGFSAFMLNQSARAQQGQRFSVESSPLAEGRLRPVDVALMMLTHRLRLADPPFARGFELYAEFLPYLQPGFHQLKREDAAFAFLQGRALMLLTGSWDAFSLQVQASFAIDAFPLPLPQPTHPHYGPQTWGPTADATANLSIQLGITRRSRHPEVALDFLRFATSLEGNALFSRQSHWLPSVIGVTIPPALAPFAPVEVGYPAGFDLDEIGVDTRLVFLRLNHLLIDLQQGAGPFIAAADPQMENAIRADLARALTTQQVTLRTQDTIWAAYEWLARRAPLPSEEAATMREHLTDISIGQFANEIGTCWLQYENGRRKLGLVP